VRVIIDHESGELDMSSENNTRSAGALRKAAYAAGAVSLAVAGILITVPSAYADDSTCTPAPAWDETVVVTPAVNGTPGSPAVEEVWHWANFQRYSWTGGPAGPQAGDIPPGENWQANTTNYEGAGHGTDPINEIFQTGTPGKSDWFYWSADKIIDVEGHPAVPPTEGTPAVTKVVHHDAVTCPATVVTPPVVTPPVVAPAPQTHTVPATVQTDGDTSWIPIAAGGLGALAAASLAGAGLLMRGRRS